VIFMAGLTHSNDTTGKDKKANGFRHFFNGYMSGAALAPVLEQMYGADRTAYHLTADYTWGWTQQESIQQATEAKGWKTANNVLTPLATTDFSSYVAPVLNSGADVLVLNHYGGNMVRTSRSLFHFTPASWRVVLVRTLKASSVLQTGTGPCRTLALRPSLSPSEPSTASHHPRRLTRFTVRHFSMRTHVRLLAHSTHVVLLRLWKVWTSTVLATVQQHTVPKITSASKTCSL